MTGSSGTSRQVIDKAIEILSNYPLCDSCLGRAFSGLATGLSDRERGYAIKVAVMMELDRRVKEQEIQDLSQVRAVLENMVTHSERMYEAYFSETPKRKVCYVCQGKIDEIIDKVVSEVAKALKGKEKARFVIGLRVPKDLEARERELVDRFGLTYYEPLKDEVKREAGKRLAQMGFNPDVDRPELEVIYDLESGKLEVNEVRRRHALAYIRLSRNVPISSWYARNERKSLEEKLGEVQSPYSEPSHIRVLDEYLLITRNPEEGEFYGYLLKDLGELVGKELKVAFTVKPSFREYRVLHECGRTSTERVVYGRICETVVKAKDWEEAKSLLGLSEEEIIAVDLIKAYGNSSKLVDLLVSRLAR